MKKIKEWFNEYKDVLEIAFGRLICILLAVITFLLGYDCGLRDCLKVDTASAETLTSAPSDYHYPLKLSFIVDSNSVMLNQIFNTTNTYRTYSYYSDIGVSVYSDFDNLYSGLLSPISGYLMGDYDSSTLFNRIELDCKYFKYVSAPLLSLGVSQSDIQNSYAIYVNDDFRSSINRISCSYQYNLNESDRVVSIVNQPLEPYLLSTAISEYPAQYSDNAFTKFPAPLFGSPSYDGVWLINPFRAWDDNPDLSDTFVANIYNFHLVIEFNPNVSGRYVDDNSLSFAYCSFLYDYSANFPTRTITKVSWLESIANSVDSFLEIEILPDLSFYDILILCIVIPLVVAMLVAWLGG